VFAEVKQLFLYCQDASFPIYMAETRWDNHGQTQYYYKTFIIFIARSIWHIFL